MGHRKRPSPLDGSSMGAPYATGTKLTSTVFTARASFPSLLRSVHPMDSASAT